MKKMPKKKRMQMKEEQLKRDAKLAKAMRCYGNTIRQYKDMNKYVCFHNVFINGLKIKTAEKSSDICDICGCSIDSNPAYVNNGVAEVIDKHELLHFSKENIEKYITLESKNKYREFDKSDSERCYKEPVVDEISDSVSYKKVFCCECFGFNFFSSFSVREFSDILKKMMEERGLKNSDVYKKANIDAKLFSKILKSNDYHPRKSTVLAIAIAMKLSIPETNEFLRQVGYALSPNILSDIIVKYCIESEIYDIDEVNSLLFEYDQKILGSKLRED